ncbi:MAG: dodecin family protein [Phycisphaeraceae bacterium]
MAVAKTIEISSSSRESFEDAIKQGIARASRTIDDVKDAWVKEQKVIVENNQVAEYRVHMMVTFLLHD